MSDLPISKNEHWPDEAATQAFAIKLAHALMRDGLNGCITLTGDLGAGKTTLARHLLRALHVKGRIKSPTYAVVEPYETTHGAVWHFDFYRFTNPREWEDAGFRDIFSAPGLKLCEWPEHVQGLLPTPDLSLCLDVGDETQRNVRLHIQSARGQRWLT